MGILKRNKHKEDPKEMAEKRLTSKSKNFSKGSGLPEGQANTMDTSKKGYSDEEMPVKSPAGEEWAKMKNPPKPMHGIIQQDRENRKPQSESTEEENGDKSNNKNQG